MFFFYKSGLISGQRNPIFTPADMSGYRVGGRTPSALKRLQAERNSRRWDLLASKRMFPLFM